MNSMITSKRLVITGGDYALRYLDSSVVVSLYEELQLCTVEACFPQEDWFTFASRTSYFGIISSQKDEVAETDSFWAEMDKLYKGEVVQGPEDTQLGLVVGIIYLMSSQTPPYPPGSMGELSFGIIIAQQCRGKGFAKEALEVTLNEVFKNMSCHRIQASLLDTSAKDRAMRLFMGMRFAHEGKRRRAFFSIVEQQWKDTTCVALLDTDWFVRSKYLIEAPPTTLWDEMLRRHHREREELLQWEESQSPTGLKRTYSMETIRVTEYLSDANDTDESAVSSDAESSYEERHSVPKGQIFDKGKGKGKRLTNVLDARSINPLFFDSSESESDEPTYVKIPRLHSIQTERVFDRDGPSGSSAQPFSSASSPPPPLSYVAASPNPSLRGVATGRSRSSSLPEWEDYLDGYASSHPSSQWDVLEPHELASPTFSLPSPSESSHADKHAL
ncbi:hypothetical protein J3R30DRAFT_1610592 [Lentinula aciculospora]|uniref:N-acetyltransferase domain-containing protein n=1 Tax=Lentinula aciculospora TaxID=153920 RepID=A0A9W9DG43_9AGAR|nr:hypothetical protein J3R30DRAFT_1610592 [Lentinula aciculospora]